MKPPGTTTLLFCRILQRALVARARLQTAICRLQVRRLRRRLFFRGNPVQTYYLQIRLRGQYHNSRGRWITVTVIEGWTRADAEISARLHLGSWARCYDDYRLVPNRPINTEATRR